MEEEGYQSYLNSIFRILWVKMIPDKFKIFEDCDHNVMMIKNRYINDDNADINFISSYINIHVLRLKTIFWN